MSKRKEQNRNSLKLNNQKVSSTGQIQATRSTELKASNIIAKKPILGNKQKQQKQRRFKEEKKQQGLTQNKPKLEQKLDRNSGQSAKLEKPYEPNRQEKGSSDINTADLDSFSKQKQKQVVEQSETSIDIIKGINKRGSQMKIGMTSERKTLTEQNEQQKKEERVDYLSILVKYKKLAGSPKVTPKIKSAIQKQKQSGFRTQREVKLKNQQRIQKVSRIKSNSKEKPNTEQLVKEKQDVEEKASQEKGKGKQVSQKTIIRFLLQKERQSKQIKMEQPINKKMNGTIHGLNPSLVKTYVQSLMETRRSQSLPLIKKQIAQKSAILKKSKDKVKNPEEEKGKSVNDRKRELNSVGFMLINLKQKLGDSDLSRSKVQIRAPSSKIVHEKRRPKQIEKEKESSSEKVVLNIKKNEQQHDQIEVINVQKESAQNKTTINLLELEKNDSTFKNRQRNHEGVRGAGLIEQDQRLKKLANKATRLQQIMEDIENENHQKEQQLKQHNSTNKLLQISILQKKKRISDLQSQLQQLEVAQSKSKQGEEVKELRQRKIAREKLYRDERERIQAEMKKVEGKIYQQQKKYTKLKQDQIGIKDHELREKQKALETKNKQLEIELEKKTKQLEETIKKEQQKSEFYKKELAQQATRNKEISEEIKKQEDLEKLLLDQLQKILKDKQFKNQQKNEEKNKQRQRLLEQIKMLEQTESRILLEYQRDIQAAHTMFESMRQKNIQLENKIKIKNRQKQQVLL